MGKAEGKAREGASIWFVDAVPVPVPVPGDVNGPASRGVSLNVRSTGATEEWAGI